jgi:glutathione S-transferase
MANILIIGDYNLSSWSMRAWLALKASGLKFETKRIFLDRPDTHKKIKKFSPTGRVPAFIFNKQVIWDSLAIAEFAAEISKNQTKLWPVDQVQRAAARSLVCEMHSGFQSLRSQLSMNINLKTQASHLSPSTLQDIDRIGQLWRAALSKSQGPFLFGGFGIVDAFYAPVVFRFISYGVKVTDPALENYMKAIKNHPFVKQWVSEAKREKIQIPQD